MSAPLTATQVTATQLIDRDSYTILLTVHDGRWDGTDTIQVALTPAQAYSLDVDLWTAAQPPERCQHCEAFSVVTVEGDELCAGHAKSYDHATEASAS